MPGFESVCRSWIGLAAALASLLVAGDARGQQAQQSPCADEAHHQFDF